MTLWDLCPGILYGFMGLASNCVQFSYIEHAGQGRHETIALLKNRRIPIRSWGWRMSFTKMPTLDGGNVGVVTWTFLVRKAQVYWALQALQESKYELTRTPRGAHKYPGKQGKKKKRKKKTGWRL